MSIVWLMQSQEVGCIPFVLQYPPVNIQKRLQKLGKLWSLLTRNVAGLSKNLESRFRGHMVLCIHGTPQKLVPAKCWRHRWVVEQTLVLCTCTVSVVSRLICFILSHSFPLSTNKYCCFDSEVQMLKVGLERWSWSSVDVEQLSQQFDGARNTGTVVSTQGLRLFT